MDFIHVIQPSLDFTDVNQTSLDFNDFICLHFYVHLGIHIILPKFKILQLNHTDMTVLSAKIHYPCDIVVNVELNLAQHDLHSKPLMESKKI